MSDDILTAGITDPRGERLLDAMKKQDLSILSVSDLEHRIAALKQEITRAEGALGQKAGANAAAEALFKS